MWVCDIEADVFGLKLPVADIKLYLWSKLSLVTKKRKGLTFSLFWGSATLKGDY